MRKKILCGTQCSGKLHIGNLLSTIIPTINLSKDINNEILVFIANLHTLTSLKDPKQINENLYNTAAKWLSFGLDPNKNIFYRQSKITGVCELTWIFNCLTPYKMLSNAHAFKDKSDNLKDVNIGLFDYPVLMASDILLFDIDLVVVGKDQKQHIEITRDIATIFNNTFGSTFKLPEEYILKEVGLFPGTDGRKMSKSYKNTIDICDDDDQLLKSIMSIKTDSKTPEESKNPDECIIFNIYKNIGDKSEVDNLREKYIKGGIMYKDVKMLLYKTILTKFKEERYKFKQIVKDTEFIDNILKKNEEKVQEIANYKLTEVKKLLNY